MILPTMGNLLIGLSFFKQYSKALDIRNHLLHFSDVSLQLRKANGKYNCDICEHMAAKKNLLSPYQQFMVPVCNNAKTGTTTGPAEAIPTMTRKEAVLFTPAEVEFKKGYTKLHVTNTHHHFYTINAGAIFGNFTVIASSQAKHVKIIASSSLSTQMRLLL